jgi:hypothetical protein
VNAIAADGTPSFVADTTHFVSDVSAITGLVIATFPQPDPLGRFVSDNVSDVFRMMFR